MKSVSGRAAIGTAAALGLLCLVLPTSVWLALAGALSPDGEIGDPSVARLVGHAGRVLGLGLWLCAAGWWRRERLRAAAGWVAACPPRRWLVVLAVVVVVPRVLWLLLTHTTPHVDLAWYDTHAQELLSGRGYTENGWPSAFWPIGYPAFLAVLYRLFGTSLLTVKLAQVLVSYVTTVLLWRVGRHVLSEGGARLAAILYALCPSTVMFTELLSTETLFATLLVACWALLLLRPDGKAVARSAEPDAGLGGGKVGKAVARTATQEPGPGGADVWRRRIYLGVLVGLGVLVKPVLLPWPALALLLVGGRAHFRRAVPDVVVAYALALCVLAPWTYRNYRAFGRFVLVSTNAGFNLYVGNGPDATGAVRTLPESAFAPYRAMENEAERDRALHDAALGAIRADPGRFVRLVPAKLAALLRDDSAALRWAASGPNAPHWSAARALVTRLALDGYYYACGVLALLWAVGRGWRYPPAAAGAAPAGWVVLWSWAAYILVVHGVYYGDPRYHQVLWPLLALVAAGGLGRFWPAGRAQA